MFKNKFAKETLTYILVGGTNTLLGWALSYLLSNVFHLGYWPTSVICFAIGGTYTYLLNRKYTFDASSLPHKKTLPRFALNLIVCYLISYFPAKLALDALFGKLQLGWSEDIVTYAKLIIANILFIIINYLGQKFFAFKKEKAPDGDAENE